MRFVLQEYGVAQGWTVASRAPPGGGPDRRRLRGPCFPSSGARAGHVPWDPALHPRLAADLTGSGAADLLGFADDGLWVLLPTNDGPLGPQLVIHDFGTDQAWRTDAHVRVAADLTGDGRADIVGFGDAGVYVSLNLGVGPRPLAVLTP